MASTLVTCADTAARPGSPSAGDAVYQVDTKQVIVYDGSVWRAYDSDGTGGYDLDGTNVLAAAPLFHFDAGFINGVDASGNPGNGVSFTGQWTSKVGGKTTVAQGTAASQPVYYTSGENSKPYLDFDGTDDFLDLTTREYCGSDLTVLIIAKAETNGEFGIIGTYGADGADHGTGAFVLGGDGIFYGYSSAGVLLYFSSAANGYISPTTHATGKDFSSETRSVIYTKTASGGTCYIDGNNASSPGTSANARDTRFGRIGHARVNKFDGALYEIALFNSALSTTDLNAWGTYVTTKYGAGGSGMESQTSF